MKYLEMLKKGKNTYPDALPKLSEPPFDSNDSEGSRHVSEKKAAPSKRSGPEMDYYDLRISAVIKELDQAGASVLGVPENAMRKALEIEQEITEAALDDDMPRFWSALREWRAIWLKSLH